MSHYRLTALLRVIAIYSTLIIFAFFMLFPFIYMVTTSLKDPGDTFRYPPRLLPRQGVKISVPGYPAPLPLYHVTYEGEAKEFVLIDNNIKVGTFADPAKPELTVTRLLDEVAVTEATVDFNGKTEKLYGVVVAGQTVNMVLLSQTVLGRFVDPNNPQAQVLQNVRLTPPVERLTAHPENYQQVLTLNNMGRSLANTLLVTLLTVIGQLATSVLGGYAFARLQFPGRDQLFVFYLGTIMIPFVLLIIPLYQLMVAIGWVDKMAALIVPWIFTAYGTFLMRQFFITMPKEIEEAALIDGASRFEILWRIFLPASVPALATQATFTFLYAWNSFFWPLVIVNTGNESNHVLTLALNVLRGRASDSPNLILAGAAISILPPVIVFTLAQRFFVESVTSSGVKG